ncbi:MAG: hypothetical protein J6T73_01375, partial [Clostridia bacterium]|nr:hypothetical protein [Clostridia bacterium]
MRILVCIRIGTDGEINPFDACAYELALSQPEAEVILLSMGPESVKGALLNLTRLGARKAYLLTDTAFAGADTLATAYTLSLAVKKLNPNLIFCGRQTLVGDTGQTAVMLSELVQYSLITNVMGISALADKNIICKTREEGEISAAIPVLITVERINNLRLPSILSKAGEVKLLNLNDIGADKAECGLAGSPTRVIETHENTSGRRKCKFITASALKGIIYEALKAKRGIISDNNAGEKLGKVLCITRAPLEYAKTISDNIVFCDENNVDAVISAIGSENPDAVLFGSDYLSKRVSALVAARLKLGLCADCTKLDTDGNTLFMIRPALSGSVIAKIKSLTRPAMATVRTTDNSDDIIVTAGYGIRDSIVSVKAFADSLKATLSTT